jgi:glutaredoxin/glutathione-dependent peroxiredoxin
MTIKISSPFPSVDVTFYNGNIWSKVNTTDIFKEKNSILIGIPGAFTPICTSAHLPGFIGLQEAFKEKGIDQIICVAVNDRFVLEAWAKFLETTKICFIADGNGILTSKLDLELDLIDLGLGVRSKRYSMIVKDNIIDYFSLEDDAGKCEISSAETLLSNVP